MTTAWALKAQEVCEVAFQLLGRAEPGDFPSGSEMCTLLRALDTVLKELPLAGYIWPKLTDETALAWVSGQTISLPADYFGQAAVWRTDSATGRRIELAQIAHGRWIEQLDRTAQGTPTHFYLSPANVLYLFPVPTIDPGVYLQYQKIIDDVDAQTVPNVPQFWLGALPYGVADETSLIFAKDKPSLRLEINGRWLKKRTAALAYTMPNEDVNMTVAD